MLEDDRLAAGFSIADRRSISIQVVDNGFILNYQVFNAKREMMRDDNAKEVYQNFADLMNAIKPLLEV